jgi:hypothetical protein
MNADEKQQSQSKTEVESGKSGGHRDLQGLPEPSEDDIDEAGRESFPASDPPFWTAGVISGSR